MCATPYPVPPQQLPVEDRPAGVETESEDGIYSICGSGVDHSRESEQNYSESEKDTNGSSFGRYTGGSGSEISDVVFDNEGRVRGPLYKERTITSRRGTSEEEWEEDDSNAGFAGEGEITIREEEEGGSQLTERTDQPERALRSKGAAPAIQLGRREAVAEVTATAWISKDEGTRGTILRGETEGPEHRRHKDDLDVQLRGGSLKTLTVGQEDDQPPPIPQKEVERNQREPADLTGISDAASDEDSQEVYQEQLITNPLTVRCSSTSLGREIRKERTNYQVVEQTETPSRDPRNLGSEATPVARQLQFNFTTGEETNLNERKREYGKRKRGSDQAINYEVESIAITDSSTTDIRRNKELKGISEPEGSEEIVLSEVTEGVLEEEEEGATAWRAQGPDQPTKLIEEEDEKATDTPVEEVSSSELKTAENEADSSGVEKTVVRPGATTEAGLRQR